MAGMRDVLIHDYMGVDHMTVWKVAIERLPEIRPLLAALQIIPFLSKNRRQKQRATPGRSLSLLFMVGARGFEPPAPGS